MRKAAITLVQFILVVQSAGAYCIMQGKRRYSDPGYAKVTCAGSG